MAHDHTFEVHYGFRMVYGGVAWIRWDLLVPDHNRHGHPDKLWMYRCTSCGEQGYAIRRARTGGNG